MNSVVLDASVVLRWAFDDEDDREGAAAVAQALSRGDLTAAGPPNFLLEVAAALVQGIRTGRIDRVTADAVLDALARVSIHEAEPHGFARAAYLLAMAQSIRVPDAAYVETARSLGIPLISADVAQRRTAEATGVHAVPLDEVSGLGE